MATKEEDRLKYLVQKTFGTDAGQQLMAELHATYCARNFDENPYVMARNCGQSDLVIFLMSLMDET
jgi:hypothetical protein